MWMHVMIIIVLTNYLTNKNDYIFQILFAQGQSQEKEIEMLSVYLYHLP